VCLKSRGGQLLDEQGLRLIFGAQATLFHDHPQLLRECLGVQAQMAHAVGFQLHHLGELVLRHLLEIGGVVVAGKGIVTAAGIGDTAVELTGPGRRGALEHHVLENMRDAGAAICFVHAAGAIPDHVHHRRRPPVLLDNDAQAIRQLLLESLGQRGHGQGQGQQ
jgi:hypothetical protein